ncbi:MAG TPA: hypothetical protein VIT62_05150 [Lysobacter sp.]
MTGKKAKSRSWLLVASLIATGVIAGSVSIDGRSSPYRELTNVRETSKASDFDIKTAGLSQAAATYRLQNGRDSLPANSNFDMTWPDGTKDRAYVITPFSTVGSVPAPEGDHCLNDDDCGVNKQPK